MIIRPNVIIAKVGKLIAKSISAIGMFEIILVIRYVKVVENIDATYIHLTGKQNMYLEIGEKYVEPGYQVYDSKEQNLTEKVVITGKVDTSKKGTYRLTYTVVNSRNKTTSVVRTIVVVDKGKKPKN